MRWLGRVLIESFIGMGLLYGLFWAIGLGVGLAVGAMTAGYSGLDSPWNILAFAGFGIAAGAATLGILRLGGAVGSALLLTRWPQLGTPSKGEHEKDLRSQLMGVRDELGLLRRLVREMMPPDDSTVWYPTDPYVYHLLPQGQWSYAVEPLRREKSLHDTYLKIVTAYEEIGRLERIRGDAWRNIPAAGTKASRRSHVQRDALNDNVGKTLNALDEAMASIDASVEKL